MTNSTSPTLAYGRGVEIPVSAVGDDELFAYALEAVTDRTPVPVRLWLERHRPEAPWADRTEVVEFIRRVVSATEPQTILSASVIGVALTGLVDWAHISRGYPLRRGFLLHPDTLSLYLEALAKSGKAPGTVRNYRGYLERAAAAFGLAESKQASIPGRVVAQPYSEHELHLVRRWALGQSTELGRARAMALVSLVAGAGMSDAEVYEARAEHLIDLDDLWIRVPGDRDRLVLVRPEWATILREIAAKTGPSDPLFPRESSSSIAVVKEWANSRKAKHAPVPNRLRASWIVANIAESVEPSALLAWSGLDRGESLSYYLPFVPEVATELLRRQYIALYTPTSARAKRRKKPVQD